MRPSRSTIGSPKRRKHRSAGDDTCSISGIASFTLPARGRIAVVSVR
jgi:hypothetical protein